jgi:type II secretory pathway pseudopilin PulG
MRNPRKRQGGYLLIVLTAALSVIAFGFLAAYSTLLSKKETAELADQQLKYVLAAGEAITTVYKANAGLVDADESQSQWRDPSAFLQLAGVKSRWGLQAAVSDRLETSDVDYSVIALWLPSENDNIDPPSFNASTGIFVPCVRTDIPCNRVYTVVSGLQLQQDLRKRALSQLDNVAAAAQSFYKTQYLEDPDHNTSTNYYRAPSGCGVSPDEISCLDSYTPVSATNLMSLIGFGRSQVTNPWGYPVQTANGSIAQPPGSTTPAMAFSSQAPWSRTVYLTYAIQPD